MLFLTALSVLKNQMIFLLCVNQSVQTNLYLSHFKAVMVQECILLVVFYVKEGFFASVTV